MTPLRSSDQMTHVRVTNAGRRAMSASATCLLGSENLLSFVS